MTTTMKITLAGALLAASCAIASAQQAPTVRVRGTIEKVDGNTLTLKTGDGEHKLTLTGNAQIVAVVKASMADIKENTFLGSAAMPQPDGTQKALEVHIFPEAMRGTGEGHRPFTSPGQHHDQRHGGRRDGDGRRRRGHQGQIQGRREGDRRPAERADRALRDRQRRRPQARRGISPCMAATKKPDGTLEAARINVGRDGTVPQ